VPPTVTRLAVERRGRVAVDLDGAPWRTLPVDVVARAGLTEGRALDRAALRLLRQELRRAEDRLARASVAPAAAEESLAVLLRAGLVDDVRFARTRAASLADRGYGNAAIRYDLERRGVGPEPIREALETLEHESERARRLVERRGPGAATARYLAAKGFGEEALEAAAGADFAPDP